MSWKLLLFVCFLFSLSAASAKEIKNNENLEIPPLQMGCHPPLKPPRFVSLEEAISLTLEYQDEIKISQLEVMHQGGVTREDAGPFDPILDYTYTDTHFHHVQNINIGLKTDFEAWEHNSLLTAHKKSRLGTIYSLFWVVDQAHNPIFPLTGEAPSPRTDQYRLAFQIDQPLLRDFREGTETMTERASYFDLRAAALDNLQNVSLRIFNTISRYWEWVAAQKLVKIRENSVQRSADLVKKTRRLIKKNQLAAADIDQPLRQLAQQKVDAIIARQNAYSALQALRLAMGVVDIHCPIEQGEWIGDDYPETEFDVDEFECQMDRIIDYAIRSRFDILASASREEAWKLLLRGAYNNALPKLNVFANVSKTNFTLGKRAKEFFSSMDARKPESDLTVGVHFSMPLYNDSALGIVQQIEARMWQSHLNTQLLIQSLIRELTDALANQVSLSFALDQANEALARSQALVDHEYKRLKGGFSTLFILIDFENRLTDAQVEQVIITKQFLQNIARIRFLSSTLLNADANYNCVLHNLNVLPFTLQ